MQEITERLFEMQDLKYRDFHSKLVPNIDSARIIGVRTPQMKSYAKEIYKSGNYKEFLDEIPYTYYEEYNLHGFIINQLKDYDETVTALERFLPYVDNWATCDLLRPKSFGKNHDKLIVDIKRWIASDEPYTKRFGAEMLMTHFLDDAFKPEYLDLVATIRSEEYYVNMMTAWFFATALAKQYEATIPYIEEERLDAWTQNKAIQKSCESYRITAEQKAYLRTLKTKKK